jgi:hypothetical protein
MDVTIDKGLHLVEKLLIASIEQRDLRRAALDFPQNWPWTCFLVSPREATGLHWDVLSQTFTLGLL